MVRNVGPAGCGCCARRLDAELPRIFPECAHAFRGWDGIDAHWRSKHEHFMSYERFWSGLCTKHRRG